MGSIEGQNAAIDYRLTEGNSIDSQSRRRHQAASQRHRDACMQTGLCRMRTESSHRETDFGRQRRKVTNRPRAVFVRGRDRAPNI
jgi:hypothetical protein